MSLRIFISRVDVDKMSIFVIRVNFHRVKVRLEKSKGNEVLDLSYTIGKQVSYLDRDEGYCSQIICVEIIQTNKNCQPDCPFKLTTPANKQLDATVKS